MIYPLVLELADDGVPVAVACRVLGFSKQAFYRWRASPVSKRDWDDAHLTNAAIDAHRDDPTFGYRFIADDLAAAGHRTSERRVWRLCSQQRLWSLHSKKRGLTRKAGPPVHDDRVRRTFTAPDLDRLWLTDITEHPSAMQGSSDRWAESAPARTTLRWNRSSPCCRRTSSTGNDGRPGKSSGWRSSLGSKRPTTGNDANAVLGS